ncbi:hypothetical protein SAMN04515667_1717 [Formosa sp. Hel1_31_208]|nr:hypothetical protein SAMN04515667_1717 [Formosa sp. Hel1_31_208]
MNRLKYIGIMLFSFLLITTCQDEDKEFGNITAPTNLSLSFEIVGQSLDNPNGDGSGFVVFTATADNALNYRFTFSDNSSDESSYTGVTTHRFSVQGIVTYTVSVIATGTGGASSTTSVTLDVVSAFDDQEAKIFLTGGPGLSKTWYPKVDENGHLGVGPTLEQDGNDDGSLNGHWFPQYDSTNAFGKCDDEDTDCFCDQDMTFSLDENNQLTYTHNNNGQSFFNWAHCDATGQQCDEFVDTCFDFDTTGVSDVTIIPSSTDWSQIADPDFPAPRGSVMNFSGNAFMGYYTGVSSYEILEIEEDYLYVRFYDAVNPVLAWYQMFTTTQPD